MAKSLFWSSDEAWKALSPHLSRGRSGKPRVGDRTVISGILHVLKMAVDGATFRLWAADNDLQPAAPSQLDTTASRRGGISNVNCDEGGYRASRSDRSQYQQTRRSISGHIDDSWRSHHFKPG